MKTSKQLLSLIIILAILAGLFTAAGRMRMEASSSTVQLVMDYNDVRDRAVERRYNLNYYLLKLKENGLTSVALREVTLTDLVGAGRATVLTGSELIDRVRLSGPGGPGIVPGEIKPGYTYILTDTPELQAWLGEQFTKRLGPTRVSELPAAPRALLALAAARDGVLEYRLGFAETDLLAIQKAGLGIVPVLADYDLVTPAEIQATFGRLSEAGPVQAVIFDGREVLGYPHHLPVTAAELTARGAVFGMVQMGGDMLGYVKLTGQEQLLAQTGYQAARVYQISRRETNAIREADMIERWLVAVKETNVRILYMRPFYLPTSEEEEVWRNLNYVRDLKLGLEQAGFTTGQAVPFDPYWVHPAALLLLMAGVAAGGLLLLRQFIPLPDVLIYAVLVLLPLVFRLSQWTGYTGLLRTVAAVVGAVTFAALSVTTLLQNPRLTKESTRNLGAQITGALRPWLLAVALSLTGALLVAGILGDLRYSLELDYFRGVKALYLAPLLLVALVWLWFSVYTRERQGNLRQELGDFWRGRVTVQGVLFFAALAAVGAIYILRSGNVGAISDAEWQLRTLLEKLLIARPRTKEFLIGHPALLLAVAASLRGHRRFLLPLFVLGTVGQLSIVNTFSHIRTPLYLSLIRTANGLWLGALAGVLLITLWNLILNWWEKRAAAPKQ